MNHVTRIIVLLGFASNAYAAGGPEDASNFLVWAFLGFCGVVSLAQVVPALVVFNSLIARIAGNTQTTHAFASWGSE